MRIAVTTPTGNVGRHVVTGLIRAGVRPLVLVRDPARLDPAIAGLVSVSGYLIGNQKLGLAPLPPKAELQWWYQFYFATDRGRAGYEKYVRCQR